MFGKWKRYAQQLETRQEERLAEGQILKERDEARAEIERLREAIREIEAAEDEGDRSRLLHALDRASDLVGDSRN